MRGTSKAALAVAWALSLAVIALTLPTGRPVNDDYWGLGALMADGFGGSLVWYYTEFQGNVVSWLFILLHELTWIDGVGWWGSAPTLIVTFAILSSGVWGGLAFAGWHRPSGWAGWALISIASVVSWLSLASLISPNAMTLAFYLPSTIVHVWPWCFALAGLGLVSAYRPWGRLMSIAVSMAGFLAGSLGFVEGLCIAAGTAIIGVFAWRRPSALSLSRWGGWSFAIGLGLGLILQLASPATWGRGGGLGSEAALTTNVQAVERLLVQGDALIGTSFSKSMLEIMGTDGWARVLVPVAVVGDLLLRPGLLAVLVLAGWWVSRTPQQFRLDRAALAPRILALLVVVLICGVAYAGSGALYAYAGRHVAGLALVVTALVSAWSIYLAPWWAQHGRFLIGMVIVAIALVAFLAVQQLRWGFARASAWDAALEINRVLIAEGRVVELVDVPLKAGLSQSGLRDHDGSGAYIEWVRRQ